nr:unnamed protein product [Naegleria fowleri]
MCYSLITPSLLEAIMLENEVEQKQVVSSSPNVVLSPPLMENNHPSDGTNLNGLLNHQQPQSNTSGPTHTANPLSCSPEFSLPSDILLSLQDSPSSRLQENEQHNQETTTPPQPVNSYSLGTVISISEELLACSPPLFVQASKPQVNVQLSPKRKKKKLSNNERSPPNAQAQHSPKRAFGDELNSLLVSQDMEGKIAFHKFQTVNSPPRCVQEFDIHSNTRVFILDLNLNEAASNEEPQILEIVACEMMKNGTTFKETGIHFQTRIIQKDEDISNSSSPFASHDRQFISDALFNLSRFIFSNCFSTDVNSNYPTKIVTLNETVSSPKLSLLQKVIDIVTKSPGLDHTNGLLNRLLELICSHTISLLNVFGINIRQVSNPKEALQYFGNTALLTSARPCSCITPETNTDLNLCAHQACQYASSLLQSMYPYLDRKREEFKKKALNDSLIELDLEIDSSLLQAASDAGSNAPPVDSIPCLSKERKRKTPEKTTLKTRYSKIKVSPRVNVVVPSSGKKKSTLNLKTVKSCSPKKKPPTAEGQPQNDNKENKACDHSGNTNPITTTLKKPVFVAPPLKKPVQQNIRSCTSRIASSNNSLVHGNRTSTSPSTINAAAGHVMHDYGAALNTNVANKHLLQGASSSSVLFNHAHQGNMSSSNQGPVQSCHEAVATFSNLTESMVESILSPKSVPILHYFSTCKPKALEPFWKSPRNTMIIKLRPFLSLRDLIQKFHEHPCLGLNNLVQFCKKIFNLS